VQSRRRFLTRLAGTAGAAVTYDAMTALGLLAVPAAPVDAGALAGRAAGTQVIVLGGGLAGLATAYELRKLGYDCRLLEARMRPGGRCVTVRRGFESEERGSSQTAEFDEGLFFNAGPMRIPHHHQVTLAYLREFNLPIEVFVDDNANAFIYQTKTASLKGARLRAREVRADLSGYTFELLAKALSPAALNQPLTKADREALIEYLRKAGGLDLRNAYRGSPRRGYVTPPGAGDAVGTVGEPIPLHDLLVADVDRYLDIEYLHQPAMFQVSGGTDRLAYAFADRLKDRVSYGAEVEDIQQRTDAVTIIYRQNGQTLKADAQFVVCAMPLPIVAALADADLSPEVKKAAAAVPYAATGKIGLQFKRRFWEEDDGIYGGSSRTDQEIQQIVYPSTGFLGRKGILIGYYQTSGTLAAAMGKRTPAQRTDVALAQGELIHPQYRKEFESAFSVAWENVPWNKGGWSLMGPELRKTAYPLLLKPDRRVYFAGDHLSYLSGWMQGALESAQQTVGALHARAMQAG
jgi:monoamine oxidase